MNRYIYGILRVNPDRFEEPNWIQWDPMETNVTLVLIPELVRRTGFNNIRLGKWAYEKWIWRNVFVWSSDLFDLIYHIILNNDSQETSAKNE